MLLTCACYLALPMRERHGLFVLNGLDQDIYATLTQCD